MPGPLEVVGGTVAGTREILRDDFQREDHWEIFKNIQRQMKNLNWYFSQIQKKAQRGKNRCCSYQLANASQLKFSIAEKLLAISSGLFSFQGMKQTCDVC